LIFIAAIFKRKAQSYSAKLKAKKKKFALRFALELVLRFEI